MTAENEGLARGMVAALNHRLANGHQHHSGCIHNLPPEEQVTLRGKSVEWWMTVIGSMPIQITPEDWEIEPPEFVQQMKAALTTGKAL